MVEQTVVMRLVPEGDHGQGHWTWMAVDRPQRGDYQWASEEGMKVYDGATWLPCPIPI